MTRDELVLYVSRFGDFGSWPATRQIDYLAYYILGRDGVEGVTSAEIGGCMTLLDLRPYGRLNVYLSEQVARKDGRYVKHAKGYRLERTASDEIRAAVDSEPRRIHVAKQLSDLVPKVKDTQEREFLEEAIRSYRVEAYRATIVMIWILTIDHLQKFVFGAHLAEFNTAIAAHPDKKMQPIVAYDDFSNLKESRVIELMRKAGIISNDVRKILDEKLGIRNSAGHPSGIKFSSHKTTEFTLDLIENILLKY